MSKIKLTEEELEEQRAIKQTYLRKEIVDSGLDALSFQNYLESLKIQGFCFCN